jgi:glycerol-3-phosphate O-acyltransferase
MLQALSWRSFRALFSDKVDLRRKIHLLGQTEQIRRLSQKGTVVLVPTHFSNLDSILIGWAIYELGLPPFCYGAGLNLFTNPVFGYFMNNLGAYKVDRRKRHLLYKQTLKNYSTVILERGCHSLFFPGGGRSRSGGIEANLKPGLLGTSIDAYVNNLLEKRQNPNVYIIPCVISYHFVLEAATLIGDYLSEQGKSRFIIEDDESSKPKEMAQFLYKFFKTSSSIYLNFGRALDPFGNFVDDEGFSLAPRGHRIDPSDFVRSNGVITHIPQRDHEYTRLLGERIIERYRTENIALTSHFIAYAYFELLRRRFDTGNLFRIFRLNEEETLVSYQDFAAFAGPLLACLQELGRQEKLVLEPALRSSELRNIIESAQRNMGVFHSRRPLKIVTGFEGEQLACEDVKLLYYYHNRMLGYDLDGGNGGPGQ